MRRIYLAAASQRDLCHASENKDSVHAKWTQGARKRNQFWQWLEGGRLVWGSFHFTHFVGGLRPPHPPLPVGPPRKMEASRPTGNGSVGRQSSARTDGPFVVLFCRVSHQGAVRASEVRWQGKDKEVSWLKLPVGDPNGG